MTATNYDFGQVVKTREQIWDAVTHPAFRLGALDFAAARPLDHDAIFDRIADETPLNAFLAWPLPTKTLTEMRTAQLRYEEGRVATAIYRLKFRAWSDPRFPPAAFRSLVDRLVDERSTHARPAGLMPGRPRFDAP